MMRHHSQGLWTVIATLLLASIYMLAEALEENGDGVKTSVYLSPKFVMGPGSVTNKFYRDIDFPKGHIAIKSFDAEVIDEAGNPVALHETYLHHWVVVRYHKKVDVRESSGSLELTKSDYISVRNQGVCNNLGQYFGLGSETRKTSTHVPDPYGIEVGNPAEIPPDYEEKWMLNVHAIDTRGVEDKLGCTECKCDLYNVTIDEYDRPLQPGYIGGLYCCYDDTQCRLREGLQSTRRGLYMKYTVKWVDWDSSIIPVRIYIFDVTDTWKRPSDSAADSVEHHCKVEYEVESCRASGVTDNGCIDTKRASATLPSGGYVIYGVAHQHSGGIGSALYGEDGRVICSSIPAYGNGKEAGNEAGYIIGMSTCYPQPGSVKISNGELLTLESNYSSTRMHTGVMGLFYILVADTLERPIHSLHVPNHKSRALEKCKAGKSASEIPTDSEGDADMIIEKHSKQLTEKLKSNNAVWAVALLGIALVAAAGVVYRRRTQRGDGYQSLMI